MKVNWCSTFDSMAMEKKTFELEPRLKFECFCNSWYALARDSLSEILGLEYLYHKPCCLEKCFRPSLQKTSRFGILESGTVFTVPICMLAAEHSFTHLLLKELFLNNPLGSPQ